MAKKSHMSTQNQVTNLSQARGGFTNLFQILCLGATFSELLAHESYLKMRKGCFVGRVPPN